MLTNLSSTNCVVSAVNCIVKLNRENLFRTVNSESINLNHYSSGFVNLVSLNGNDRPNKSSGHELNLASKLASKSVWAAQLTCSNITGLGNQLLLNMTGSVTLLRPAPPASKARLSPDGRVYLHQWLNSRFTFSLRRSFPPVR